MILTDISGFRIIIEFLDVQVTRVDVVEFFGLLVPSQAVGDANFAFQWHKLLLVREAIKRTQALLENVNANLCAARKKQERESAMRIKKKISDFYDTVRWNV